MLTTTYRKGFLKVAAICDEKSGRPLDKVFIDMSEHDDEEESDSEEDPIEDSEEEEEEFRIPMAKKMHFDKEIGCDPGEMMRPIYNPKERITMFIAGAQNCGKSYFIGQFLYDYKMIHPKRPVYLITGIDEKDKSLGSHKIRKIFMDEKVIDDLNLEKLRVDDKTGKKRGCLLIFDDTDRIRDAGLRKKVYDLLNDALCNGRDHATQAAKADIDVIVTNHEINDYQRTKSVLTECNYVVIFPAYSVKKQIDMVLDKIGLSKEVHDMITSYTGRAVVLHKTAPLYGIMKRKVFMLR